MNNLYEQLKQGNKQTWKQVYQKHYPNCKWPVLKNGGSEEEAQFVFNKVMSSLWEKLRNPDFDAPNNLEAYLYQACRFEWNNQRRKKQRQQTDYVETMPESLQEDGIEEMEILETRWSQIYNCLEQLGDNCRELIKLSFLVQEKSKRLSDNEIADKFGWKYSYVRQRRYKCVQKVKECVELNSNHNET